jgi:hypothetical protein
MPDEVDLANDLIDSEVSRALSKIRQGAETAKVQGSDYCLECGDDMLKERKKLGFKFCVPCASESERRKSLYAE